MVFGGGRNSPGPPGLDAPEENSSRERRRCRSVFLQLEREIVGVLEIVEGDFPLIDISVEM